MKAIHITEFGGPEVLKYEDAEMPTPGPGQVRIKVAATSVNYADIGRRAGHFPLVPGESLPMIPGLECAGIVDEVGAGVTSVKPGDRVLARSSGSYAEYAVTTEDHVYKAPESVTLTEAATLDVMFATAWQVLVNQAKVQRGETVLVQAAASGVGIAVVQLAKYLGATVIGTASTDDKLEWAKGYGLDHGINYTTQDFEEEIKKMTGGKGVPVVVDGIGDEVFKKGLRCLSSYGRMVVYGVASGKRSAEVLIPQLFFGNHSILGAASGSLSHDEVDRMLGLFGEGALKPTIDKTWPLAEAAEAHRYIERRNVKGKVALIVE